MWDHSHFVFYQKFRSKHSVEVHCHSGETNPLDSIFQVAFITHFLTDIIWHKCNNTSLQFALVEQIRNEQLCEHRRGVHIWLNSSCPSRCGGDDRLFNLDDCYCVSWLYTQNPCHLSTWYSLWKEFWVSFQPLWNALASSDKFLLPLLNK